MIKSHWFRVLLGAILCLAVTGPAFSASEGLVASKRSKASTAAATDSSPAALQQKLEEFAQKTIASINRCVLPSASKKEITSNGNGSFTARYIEIDPKSVSTSYKPSENSSVVKYIGYMNYQEVEYTSTASSKSAAAQGPFTPIRREQMTELIKYVNGKWTY